MNEKEMLTRHEKRNAENMGSRGFEPRRIYKRDRKRKRDEVHKTIRGRSNVDVRTTG